MVSPEVLAEMTACVAGLVTNSLGEMSPAEREAVHRESWFTTMQRDRAAFKSTIAYEQMLLKLKEQEKSKALLTPAEIAVLECLHYLVHVEGPLQTMCAQLCLYAVKANLPFEVRRHGATFTIATPEEILRTSLSEKLAFLETCNVRIPPGIYNPKLRNSVAHMDFTVLDDGTISYDDEQIAYDRLERLVWNTRDVFVTIQRAVANVVGEFLRRDGCRGPFPTPLPPPPPEPPE